MSRPTKPAKGKFLFSIPVVLRDPGGLQAALKNRALLRRVARFSRPKCCSHIRKTTKSIFARAAFLLRHAGPCGLLFAGTLVVAMTKGDYIL